MTQPDPHLRQTDHYAVNMAYCNCGARLIDDHVSRARLAESVVNEAVVALAPTPDPLREALKGIAVRIVRLEGGCEKGHRAGQWHIHETPYLATGRQLAGLALAQPAPALDVERLARAEHKRALSGGDERCHHSPRSGNDCERIARFLAREYAALAEPQS